MYVVLVAFWQVHRPRIIRENLHLWAVLSLKRQRQSRRHPGLHLPIDARQRQYLNPHRRYELAIENVREQEHHEYSSFVGVRSLGSDVDSVRLLVDLALGTRFGEADLVAVLILLFKLHEGWDLELEERVFGFVLADSQVDQGVERN